MVITQSLASANFFDPESVEAALEAETEKLNAALDILEAEFNKAVREIAFADGDYGEDTPSSSATCNANDNKRHMKHSAPTRRNVYNRIAPGMQNYRGVHAVLDQFVSNKRFRESVLRSAQQNDGGARTAAWAQIGNGHGNSRSFCSEGEHACADEREERHKSVQENNETDFPQQCSVLADVDDLYDACIEALSIRLYNKVMS